MAIAILYEHPEWFRPLFSALARRGVKYVELDAGSLTWDPARPPRFELLVNRMSPSAYLRGHAHAIQAALHYVSFIESCGVPVVNGSAAYRLEISKAAQLALLERLHLAYPRSRVINNADQAVAASDGLRFPVVVKPNIGGSGARIQRFDSRDRLARAVSAGEVDLGIDLTALVQEFLPARGGAITRIELLDGELLYAIRITPPAGFGFNLCPADICRDEAEPGPTRGSRAWGPASAVCTSRRSASTRRMAVLFECDVHDDSGRLVAREAVPVAVDFDRPIQLRRANLRDVARALAASAVVKTHVTTAVATLTERVGANTRQTTGGVETRLHEILCGLESNTPRLWQGSLFDRRVEQQARASEAAATDIRDHLRRRLASARSLLRIHSSAPRLIAVWPLGNE